MDFQDMPGHLIRRLNQTSTQVFQARMKSEGLDLTSVQFAAMAAICDAPGSDQASIAAAIAYDRATIGGVIDRLEQKGWVVRRTGRKDRRAREVALTEAGHAILKQTRPVVRDLQADILSGLTEEERQTFIQLARKATHLTRS